MAVYSILFGISIFMIAFVMAIIKRMFFHWKEETKTERLLITTTDRPAVNVIIYADKCVIRRRTYSDHILVYDVISKDYISINKESLPDVTPPDEDFFVGKVPVEIPFINMTLPPEKDVAPEKKVESEDSKEAKNATESNVSIKVKTEPGISRDDIKNVSSLESKITNKNSVSLQNTVDENESNDQVEVIRKEVDTKSKTSVLGSKETEPEINQKEVSNEVDKPKTLLIISDVVNKTQSNISNANKNKQDHIQLEVPKKVETKSETPVTIAEDSNIKNTTTDKIIPSGVLGEVAKKLSGVITESKSKEINLNQPTKNDTKDIINTNQEKVSKMLTNTAGVLSPLAKNIGDIIISSESDESNITQTAEKVSKDTIITNQEEVSKEVTQTVTNLTTEPKNDILKDAAKTFTNLMTVSKKLPKTADIKIRNDQNSLTDISTDVTTDVTDSSAPEMTSISNFSDSTSIPTESEDYAPETKELGKSRTEITVLRADSQKKIVEVTNSKFDEGSMVYSDTSTLSDIPQDTADELYSTRQELDNPEDNQRLITPTVVTISPDMLKNISNEHKNSTEAQKNSEEVSTSKVKPEEKKDVAKIDTDQTNKVANDFSNASKAQETSKIPTSTKVEPKMVIEGKKTDNKKATSQISNKIEKEHTIASKARETSKINTSTKVEPEMVIEGKKTDNNKATSQISNKIEKEHTIASKARETSKINTSTKVEPEMVIEGKKTDNKKETSQISNKIEKEHTIASKAQETSKIHTSTKVEPEMVIEGKKTDNKKATSQISNRIETEHTIASKAQEQAKEVAAIKVEPEMSIENKNIVNIKVPSQIRNEVKKDLTNAIKSQEQSKDIAATKVEPEMTVQEKSIDKKGPPQTSDKVDKTNATNTQDKPREPATIRVELDTPKDMAKSKILPSQAPNKVKEEVSTSKNPNDIQVESVIITTIKLASPEISTENVLKEGIVKSKKVYKKKVKSDRSKDNISGVTNIQVSSESSKEVDVTDTELEISSEIADTENNEAKDISKDEASASKQNDRS